MSGVARIEEGKVRKKARSKKERRGGKESKKLLSALPNAMETMRRVASIIAPHSKLPLASLHQSVVYVARSIDPLHPSNSNHSKTLLISATRGAGVARRSICHEASAPTADLLRNVTGLAARGILQQPNVPVKWMDALRYDLPSYPAPPKLFS